MIPPTRLRTKIDFQSHGWPNTFTDNTGQVWKGTSRVLNRAARRRANRLSWKRMKAEARREFVASQKAARA